MKVPEAPGNHIREWLKAAGYTSLGLILFMGISEATFGEEIDKVSTLTFEKKE